MMLMNDRTAVQQNDGTTERQNDGTCSTMPFVKHAPRGGYYGNGKFLLRVLLRVYYGLLRILRSFITDITELFLRILLTLD